MHVSIARHWPAWLAPGALERVRAEVPRIETQDWASVLEEAGAQDLQPALHRAFELSGVRDQVPIAVRAVLEQAHARASLAAFGWRRALQLVLPALAGAGIEAVPYKGAVIAFGLLDDAATRPMSDIDLWVDETAMPAAGAVLEGLGFERRDGRLDRPPAWQIRVDGEIPYSGRRLGIPMVELHYGVFPGEWLCRVARIDRRGVHARLQPMLVAGVPVRVLSKEDHFVQVALHAVVTHQLAEAPVRALRDLLLLASGPFGWDAMIARARAWNVAPPLALACACCAELFDQGKFAEAAHRLVPPRRLRALRRLADTDALRTQTVVDQGWAHWRFLLALAPRRRDAARLVRRALWPEDEWLHARYGRSGWRAHARHLAGAVRGRF